MLLLLAATEMEMDAARSPLAGEAGLAFLVAGVGPVETTLSLCRYLLSESGPKITGVVNFGVAGAYRGSGLGLLALCLARSEVFGDFGVCYGEETVPFDFPMPDGFFTLDGAYLRHARRYLAAAGLEVGEGAFVTVNSASGSGRRGDLLRDRFQARCENMEGAAVAKVCALHNLPLLELRCVSNLVEDRSQGNWQLREASRKCGEAISLLVPALLMSNQVE